MVRSGVNDGVGIVVGAVIAVVNMTFAVVEGGGFDEARGEGGGFPALTAPALSIARVGSSRLRRDAYISELM
jgi:hypothetical protein